MDNVHHIAVQQGTGASNSLKNKGAAASVDDVFAFLNQLAGTAQSQPAAQPAAKIADDGGAQAPAQDVTKNLPAAGLSTQIAAQLAADTQEDPSLLATLEQKLTALLQNGAPDDATLAQFRKDAVGFLKGQGLDDSAINKCLVTLSAVFGDCLTPPQAAQLGMPVADGGAPAPEGLPAPQKPAQGLPPAQQDAGIQPPAQDQAAAPAPKTDAPQFAHLADINALAQKSDGDAGGDTGGNLFQNGDSGAQQPSPVTAQVTGGASPQSFVNYMSASNTPAATQTVQTVAVNIQRNAATGIDTFTMQLEPAELGRLEVRMKFDRDGTMRAHLIADKPETLAMLQQDAPQLHRVLQAAGLAADDGALSFDLRQQQDPQQQDSGYSYDGKVSGTKYASSSMPETMQVNLAVAAMGTVRQGGVNIMV